MEIFLNDRVGILLTKRKAIKTVKYGVRFLISNFNLKSDNSYINGINISNPPAGDGTPSKKLFFQI